MHSEGLHILSYLYLVPITSYYHILVSILYSIATELFFTFHLLSAMIMCIIHIILYYYVHEDKLCVLNSKYYFLLLLYYFIELHLFYMYTLDKVYDIVFIKLIAINNNYMHILDKIKSSWSSNYKSLWVPKTYVHGLKAWWQNN